LNALVDNAGNQHDIAQLREARTTLEERARGNENMLNEIRQGKAAAEKRETDLRTCNNKLLEELAKFREIALTPKKSSGPMMDLQTLLIKYSNSNGLLAESLQRIEAKDQTLRTQEDQIRTLSDLVNESKSQQERLMGEVQKLSEKLAENVDSVSREGRQLVCAIFPT
jgi:type I restriction-modification system DNA methylase subunit